MAKKRRINKAQAIREYLETNGIDTSPKDVIANFKSRRITISAAQVSNIKTELRGGNSKSTRGRKASGSLDLDSLIEANRFVKRAGGIDAAKQALDTLAKLQ